MMDPKPIFRALIEVNGPPYSAQPAAPYELFKLREAASIAVAIYALRRANGSRQKAASLMGCHRNTLRTDMARWGLTTEGRDVVAFFLNGKLLDI